MPPFIPDINPYIVPKTSEIMDVKRATEREILVPKIILLKISLPSSSVPKMFNFEGFFNNS